MRAVSDLFSNWLGSRARPAGEQEGYRVFTRDFDKLVKADDLDSVLGPLTPLQRVAQKDAWHAFYDGLLGWRTKTHIVALAASSRIRAKLDTKSLADTTVSILIDQSGSMRGQSMLLAAATADVASEFLSHLGVAVEVLGFTTVSWRGGKSRARWLWMGRPSRPGRLCDLLHIIYRSADDRRASTGGWTFMPMLRPDLPKENVDGEALLWAASRLRDRAHRSKILFVVSDGASIDDSTLAANDLGILDRHLRQVIGELEASTDVRVAAAGIGFDVNQYYSRAVTVETPEALGEAMIGLLEQTLLDNPKGGSEPLTFA
jgi:cobaltochelatase CobT